MFARILPFPFVCLISGATLADEIALKSDAAGYSGIVQPFIKEHCVTCHGPEKQKGKLRLDALAAFVATFDHRVAFGEPLAGGPEARSGGWLRSRLPLPPGSAALLMLADAWFPARWAALQAPVAVSTVSMQVVVHDVAPGPAGLDGFFAACYQEAARVEGFGLERGELWWPDGRLALTMQQLIWVGTTSTRPHEEAR